MSERLSVASGRCYTLSASEDRVGLGRPGGPGRLIIGEYLMLQAEARWVGQHLGQIPDSDLFPVLNIGSHTEQFRNREQPWMENCVFAPLRTRGGSVIHTDIRASEGVDIVGDLTMPSFIEEIKKLKPRTVLCCNVLEHIEDPGRLCDAMLSIVLAGGQVVVTVPHAFPYHPDPIDTMFRPSPAELCGLFPAARPVAADLVGCGTVIRLSWDRFRASPLDLLRTGLDRRRYRAGDPDAEPGEMFLGWIRRSFAVSCVLLRKVETPG